jgi:hypothetical protein
MIFGFFRNAMNLSDLVGDVAQEVEDFVGAEGQKIAEEHQFFLDATAYGLLDSTVTGLTIFLPLSYTNIDDEDDEFEEFFNRHVVKGHVSLRDEGVKQLTTLSTVVIATYSLSESEFAVAGVNLRSDMMNCCFKGCTIHAFESNTLPTLRPLPNDIAKMRIMYLGGEVIELTFEELGIEPEDEDPKTFTLMSSFSHSDRKVIADVQKTPWAGRGTTARIVVPQVATQTDAMLWLYLYDNDYRHAILTMVWPWYLNLIPNIESRSNLEITHIVPKKGKENQELCIIGTNFASCDLRVSIGASSAYIIYSQHDLIRIFIPQCSDPNHPQQPVWVANGNVYKRYDCFTYT